MRQSLQLPLMMLLLFIASCSGGEEQRSSENVQSLTLSETEESYPLRDDLRLLDNISNIVPAGEDIIILDETPGIALFRDHEMIRDIGSVGNGPCEYESITNVDTRQDSLFVFSRSQAKIITYHVPTGECLGEFTHPKLSTQSYLERVGDSFITAQTAYSAAHPDSTRLMFRLKDGEEVEELSVNLGSLNAVESSLMIQVPGMNFARQGNSLYTIFPMSDIMSVMNTDDGSIRRFPLQIDLHRDEIENAGENIDRVAELMMNESQFVWRVFASEHWVGFGLLKKFGQNADNSRWVQFYSPEGEFLNEVPVAEQPMAMMGDRLIFLGEITDPSSEYTYELVYRDVIAE